MACMNRAMVGTDWKTPAIWLAAVGIWLAVSWRLFRSED